MKSTVTRTSPQLGTTTVAGPAAGRPDDQLAAMVREVSQPGGLVRLLRWTARRVSGQVALLNLDGEPLRAFPAVPREALADAAGDIGRVAGGQARSVAVDVGGHTVAALAVGDRAVEAVFVAVTDGPLSPENRAVVTGAARLLWLRWRADEAEDRHRRLAVADARNREAVLHLLMVGHVSGARRTAAALGPALGDVIRAYVIECPTGAREEAVRLAEQACGGRAWVVRCPVYDRHVIVLAPAEPEPGYWRRDLDVPAADPIDAAMRWMAANVPGFAVGASHAVSLHDAATGYSQAFHALAVARSRPDHYAGFTPRGELAQLLGVPGRIWARRELNPLLSHVPRRRQDPDASELLVTLMSWLTFYGGAASQLRIHRNTLYGRLRLIESLVDFRRDALPSQATVHLALRLLDEPLYEVPAGNGAATLDALLATPEIRRWAHAHLAPLVAPEQAAALATVRAWLGHNARLDPAAAALGISVPGLRRRLVKVEELVNRSLLDAPSSRYDMWFALRVHGDSPATAG